METVTTATVTEVIVTAGRIATETGIAMETEIGTATGTGIGTAAAATAIVVTEMEAGGTERIGGVKGMGERGGAQRGETEEMIASLSLSHQNVERAGGTTKEKRSSRIICGNNCSMMSLSLGRQIAEHIRLTQAQDCKG